MKKHFSPSKITIFVIIVLMTLVTSNLNWTKTSWRSVIEADAKGYYAYLPATFIYNDLNFGFFDSIDKGEYYDEHMYYDYRSMSNGKVITKYYAGTALAHLPFFLAAHSLCLAIDGDADGYSKMYMVAICIGALFYLLIGLIFLNKTLSLYNVSEFNKSVVLIAMVFGTNLFYYSVSEPGLSHIVSFGFIALFLYYSKQYFIKLNANYLIYLGFILGFIVLLRPINGLAFFILPFIAGSFETLKNGFLFAFKSIKKLMIAVIVFVAFVSIQLVIYKISTGNFFIYAYGEEGFNFLSPHFTDILFSYKKGLFLYTPIYLLSFFGLIKLYQTNRFEAISWIAFFVFITYVFSSWWMWFYGGSFSSRVYVEFLPFFMILLGIGLQNLRTRIQKTIVHTVITLLIIVCQIQTFQYRYYDIHWADMTKEKYWAVFLRVDRLMNK